MENKEQNKTLTINTILCDARQVRESTLAAYDKIAINAAVLLTNQASQELLHKYPVELNAAQTLDIPGDVQVSQINGRKELGPGTPAPGKPTYLLVNGELDIAPGAGPALEGYVGIQVNGKILCPESLSGLLSAAEVNGKIEIYPDDCVRLKSTAVLDRTFLLRAKENIRYYAGRRVVALAGDIDFQKLAEKNVRFVTRELLVAESLAEAAVPLFGERTEITILPDGCAYVGDDAKLDGALIRRYGGKLYINGDLTVNEESAPWLEQVSYLRIHGDARVTKGMYDAFLAVGADYDKEEIVAGKLIQDKLSLTVDRALLEEAQEGLSIADCVNVRFREDVPAELIRDRLLSVSDCVSVVCTPEQRAAVERVARDVAEIGGGEGGLLGQLKSLLGGNVINADLTLQISNQTLEFILKPASTGTGSDITVDTTPVSESVMPDPMTPEEKRAFRIFLIGFDEARKITWNSYGISSDLDDNDEITNSYPIVDRQYQVTDISGEGAERLLNTNFRQATFAPYDDNSLWIIRVYDVYDSLEKLGDYHLISIDEAKEKLQKGESAMIGTDEKYPVEDMSKVVGIELSYKYSVLDEYTLPYYVFWVETGEVQFGLKEYSPIYVPAIEEEYISDIPTYDGSFNG